jgi:hypothetical protein
VEDRRSLWLRRKGVLCYVGGFVVGVSAKTSFTSPHSVKAEVIENKIELGRVSETRHMIVYE